MPTQIIRWRPPHVLFGALCLFALALSLMAAAAFALPPPSPEASEAPTLDLARTIFDAVASGHWTVAVGAILMLLIAVTRKVLGDDNAYPYGWIEKVRSFLHTDLGGMAAATVIGVAGPCGVALLASRPITLGVLEAAVAMTVGTSGVYVWGKKLWAAIQMYRAGGHPTKPSPK